MSTQSCKIALTWIEAVEYCIVRPSVSGVHRMYRAVKGDAGAEKNKQDPFHETKGERRPDPRLHAECRAVVHTFVTLSFVEENKNTSEYFNARRRWKPGKGMSNPG